MYCDYDAAVVTLHSSSPLIRRELLQFQKGKTNVETRRMSSVAGEDKSFRDEITRTKISYDFFETDLWDDEPPVRAPGTCSSGRSDRNQHGNRHIAGGVHQPWPDDRTRLDPYPTKEKRSGEHDRQNTPHFGRD